MTGGQTIFEDPKRYLDEIAKAIFFSEAQIADMRESFAGSSIICAWLTKRCPLDCRFCFFRSSFNCDGLSSREYNLTSKGVLKLIEFVNDSNNSYLMISGGGDPFVCMDSICTIIEKVHTKRLVLVTSGFWATSEASAKKVILRLCDAINRRTDNNEKAIEVVLRLSVDKDHLKALSNDYSYYVNIINAFRYRNLLTPNLKLYIHTMRDDNTIVSLAEMINAEYVLTEKGVSDNPFVIKIVPLKADLNVGDDFVIPVGISKVFLSNLAVDLTEDRSDEVKEATRVFIEDMERSEQDNPSYVQNALGKKGLDFWVDYNGNVCTWFNQDQLHLFNLYVDSYEDVVRSTFSNPVTLSFLRKGYSYRNSIVGEVSKKAVLRSIAINLRDYAAAILLEEHRVKLYYAVRVIRDMIEECAIEPATIADIGLSGELIDSILCASNEDLARWCKNSKYDILKQEMGFSEFDETLWADLFFLVSLGHYDVCEENLITYLNFYKMRTEHEFETISDFKFIHSEGRYERLHLRFSRIKDGVVVEGD